MVDRDDDEERERRRNRRNPPVTWNTGEDPSTMGHGSRPEFTASDSPEPGSTDYNFRRDLGQFGNRNYQYQVGDEFSNPGPEPPRDSPDWPVWKANAAAWRNFIGQRQQYVNQMIGAGYDPGDLGITPRKEEGRAGYNRLMQPGVIDQLRQNSEQYMRGTDAEVDPITGLYMTGGGPTSQYYDARGMRVNAQGRRTGGFYGQQNTMGQFGANSIPRASNMGGAAIRPTGGRVAVTPRPTVNPIPTAPISNRASNFGGYANSYGAGSLHPSQRNRRPARRYVPGEFGL